MWKNEWNSAISWRHSSAFGVDVIGALFFFYTSLRFFLCPTLAFCRAAFGEKSQREITVCKGAVAFSPRHNSEIIEKGMKPSSSSSSPPSTWFLMRIKKKLSAA
jgi:hypothetical protein